MATSLLQLQVSEEDQQDLGRVVVRFFHFYGHEFLYTRGISVLDGGRYLRIEDVPTEMPRNHRRSPLCIQDPLTPGNDVGRSSYLIWDVQKAFQHAFSVLRPALNAPEPCAAPCSLLGQLLEGYSPPQRVMPDMRPERQAPQREHGK
ncbi:Non-canonical poly(A) RNA polymerase protein Trf4-1 [Chionoecetes opilio]|uniref:Non-canonical poly(A) RNA polymerase protein Trf4-1 n=1 Tax=Chionoecetes opilio TaxID=41210 RepID=A0A8J4YMV4_CHIOP|nr:Non-canonical poly(A) RNA polymerase protein Trf4-1 [Chionoecetes opilio]